MDITGGCLCRAVRYRFAAPPLITRVCWCRLCQYLGSGNATVNACFLSAALSVQGELRDFQSVADSGNTMHRARPHLVFVRAGTLDDPELARPAATIGTLPRVSGQPPPVS